MRSRLAGSLVANVRYNLNRKQERVRVFELGRVFRADASVSDGPLTVAGIDQPLKLAAIAYGPAYPEQWGLRPAHGRFLRRQGRRRKPARAARSRGSSAPPIPRCTRGARPRCCSTGQPIGWIGELHPRWQQKYELPQAPVLFELDLDALLAAPMPAY